MRGDEREEYGEEARDVIEGLRRLAHRAETPPELRSAILAQGEQLLPPQKRHLARWWTVIAAWRPHPLAWGPVVAGAFFIAGVLTPWPRAGVALHDTVSEKASVPAAQLLSKESTEDQLAPPITPSWPPRQEMRQQIESAPAPRNHTAFWHGMPPLRSLPHLRERSRPPCRRACLNCYSMKPSAGA
jgi:hypothetical protein